MARAKKNDRETYKAPRNLGKAKSENPKWLIPTILVCLIIGLVWITVHYVTSGQYPLALGNWNVFVGFGFFAVAMGLLTRWR